MKEYFPPWPQVMTASFLSLTILFGATLLAQQVQNSSLYQQSRLFSSIFSQDGVGLTDLVTEPDNMGLLLKFVGAVTSAYINFELIPVNEARTFTAVYESMGEHIAIERFEYQRKDLMIYGEAGSQEEYEAFVERLRGTGHFDSVSGHAYTATDDSVRFNLLCASAAGQSDAAMVFAHL